MASTAEPASVDTLTGLDHAGGIRERVDRQRGWDRRVVAVADPVLSWLVEHWLFAVNLVVALVLLAVVAAPLLLAAGRGSLAAPLYDFLHGACHQWAFRSFFLLGPHAAYSQSELSALGVDPFTFRGSSALGWKMAFCERNLAIVVGLLFFGLLYATRWRRAGLRASSYFMYAVLMTPMAIDGFTQLFGWRESTWELRLATGLLFGVASAWFLYPRFETRSELGEA